MSDLALRVDGLAKSFRLGHQLEYHRMTEFIENVARNAVRLPARWWKGNSDGGFSGPRTFWALDNVSFVVPRGEVLGVIGRNGAGKSTLLKLLSRITAPTRGRIELWGRVGSLLEVGTGFHPELTGRENIFLNGAILGMTRGEILRRFDEIVAFAEIERFLDTAVKHYSSGMYVRLGFSVAAHLEPDVLIVDEVLAVGDLAFQKKCFGKMEDVTREGRTILLVSHNLSAVSSICRRAILLEEGRLVQDGPATAVIETYLRSSGTAAGEVTWPDAATAPQTAALRLRGVSVRQADSNGPTAAVNLELPIEIDIDYEALRPAARAWAGLYLRDRLGNLAFASETNNSTDTDASAQHRREFEVGRYRSTCAIPANFLNQGDYNVCVLLGRDGPVAELLSEDAVSFSTLDPHLIEKGYHTNWPGVVRPLLAWRTEKL
jgi:homopolymeric O-antigen transport system ATP-binding protein